jgi:hypothetical protein
VLIDSLGEPMNEQRGRTMSKSLTAVGAILMAAASIFTVPSVAQAEHRIPAAEAREFCESIIAEFPGHPIGGCISEFISSDEARATKQCLFLERQGLLFDIFGFNNIGECVTAFRSE